MPFQKFSDVCFDSFCEGRFESFFAASINIGGVKVYNRVLILLGCGVLPDIEVTEELLEVVCFIEAVVVIERR
jgi:hypothetical protein